jgi:hypothetical protein
VFLERSVAALEDDPTLAFVSHWFRAFGDEQWDWTPTDCGLPALLDHNTVNGAALARRALVLDAGAFDPAFRDGCEDWDLWITLVERGHRGAILPEFLFRYRRRQSSMSRLMSRGGTHPRLYRQLVDKHAATYAMYLPALLERRERDVSTLRLHIHDLALERAHWMDAQLTQQRDEVAMLERRLSRHRADAARALAIDDARHRAAQAESDAAQARDRAYERDAAAHRAEADAAGLRASLSWRLTAPLRRLVDLMTPGKARG